MASYQIDPQHVGAHFKVRHMMISNVKGEFSKVKGSVEFDPVHLAASHVEVTIDAASVSTREPERDKHLRSADFLDVKRYPAITFHSKDIVSTDSYEVAGDLTIRDVTRRVVLQVESVTPEIQDPDGLLRLGALPAKTSGSPGIWCSKAGLRGGGRGRNHHRCRASP